MPLSCHSARAVCSIYSQVGGVRGRRHDATRCALDKDEVGDCVATAVCVGELRGLRRAGVQPRALSFVQYSNDAWWLDYPHLA